MYNAIQVNKKIILKWKVSKQGVDVGMGLYMLCLCYPYTLFAYFLHPYIFRKRFFLFFINLFVWFFGCHSII